MIDPEATVEYLSRIADGGKDAPRYEIEPADQPGLVIHSGSPTGAWAQVIKAVNRIRNRNHSDSVSGLDQFGLSQNIIKSLIQELPGAKDLANHVWQTYIEDHPPPRYVEEPKKRILKRPGGYRKRNKDGIKGEYDDDEGGYGEYSRSPSAGAQYGGPPANPYALPFGNDVPAPFVDPYAIPAGGPPPPTHSPYDLGPPQGMSMPPGAGQPWGGAAPLSMNPYDNPATASFDPSYPSDPYSLGGPPQGGYPGYAMPPMPQQGYGAAIYGAPMQHGQAESSDDSD